VLLLGPSPYTLYSNNASCSLESLAHLLPLQQLVLGPSIPNNAN
jgi:hypothetical protein